MKNTMLTLGLMLGSMGAPGAFAKSVQVHMAAQGTNYIFKPATISIKAGDTVKWINDDASKQPHTVTSGKVANNFPNADHIFDSGMMMPGQSFEYTFSKAGEYPYFCLPHAMMKMVGTVKVK